MYGHRSFLMLDPSATGDVLTLIKGGYEIAHLDMSFQQGVDRRGKATTRVYSGLIQLTLSQLPPDIIVEWGIESRKSMDGVIIMLDNENTPMEKIYFNHAYCVELEIDYLLEGTDYSNTRMAIQAEQIVVGDGINFKNDWTKEWDD